MARIRLENISKSFGPHRAVDQLDLDVADGEFFVLLGPTGAGKTTTLRMIAGLEKPTTGAIHINQVNVNDWGPAERDVALVLQQYSLYPRLTVRDNLAFPLRSRIRRMSEADIDKRIDYASKTLRIAHLLDRKTDQLSGGEMQRVSIGRAIVREPQVFLMDEPLSALDKQLRETMQIELRQLHKRLGATIIYVTHDQREALTMSDRVAILKDGRLVQIDRPERLHDHPANAFVASFIGEATLLPVTRAGQDSVSLAGTILKSARPIAPAGELVLAIQTEKLLIEDGTGSPDRNRLEARVTDVVFQGESLRVFLALDDGTALSLRQPSHYEAARRIPPIGERLAVSLHPQDTIIVPKTGA